jgi:hypothetical protein
VAGPGLGADARVVARRLLAEPVASVFAVRTGTPKQGPEGLPELPLCGLSNADARAVLDAALRGPLDKAARDRIVAESRGNPLALLELSRGLTPAELAGGFGLPGVKPLASLIEQGFARRLQPLPAQTRRLLLTAAAEPAGDVTLLWRADRHLTAGLAVIGRHLTARIGPERNMSAPLTPCGPPGAARVSQRHISGPVDTCGGRGQQPVRRMLSPGHPPPGSEPAEFQMVRRRSTVRFRKRAPCQRAFSNGI